MANITEYEISEHLIKGSLDLGSLHLVWDFSDIIKQKKREEKIRTGGQLANGRFIIPSLGIYWNRDMEKMKHFLGWLFVFCPYGGHCPPEHPFRKNDVVGTPGTNRADFHPGGSGAGWNPPKDWKEYVGGGGC